MSGKLIVLEGLDGSGKATQTALLCKGLEQRGLPLKHISFPDYGQPSSALVKMYLAGEFGKSPDDVNAYAASSFYAVDRFASYATFWKTDYQEGKIIVADRYVTSNLVFQMAKAPREDWDTYMGWVDDFEYGKLGLPRPDVTLYLDMPPQISQKLLTGRYHGDEQKKDIHESNRVYLEHCRESASYAAKKLGWRVINCARGDNARSIEEIHEEIMRIIMEDGHCYAGISRN